MNAREDRGMTPRAIVVRKRTPNETRDLALLAVGKNFKTLLCYFGALALPVYLLDVVLLVGFCLDLDDQIVRRVVLFTTWFVVVLQSDFIGSLMTQYLGIWLFQDPEKPIKHKEVVAAWKKRLPQLLYYLVFTRLIRTRFFYAEAILLEQTPYKDSPQQTSTYRRVRVINKLYPFGGENFATRFYLFSGVWGGYWLLAGCVNALVPESEPATFLLDYILAPLFMIACELYTVAYKFFSYINYRIVNEGWDIDLAFVEEVARLTKDGDDDDLARRRPYNDKKLGALTLEADIDAEPDADYAETEATS